VLPAANNSSSSDEACDNIYMQICRPGMLGYLLHSSAAAEGNSSWCDQLESALQRLPEHTGALIMCRFVEKARQKAASQLGIRTSRALAR
jgi:hypothetical protein